MIFRFQTEITVPCEVSYSVEDGEAGIEAITGTVSYDLATVHEQRSMRDLAAADYQRRVKSGEIEGAA